MHLQSRIDNTTRTVTASRSPISAPSRSPGSPAPPTSTRPKRRGANRRPRRSSPSRQKPTASTSIRRGDAPLKIAGGPRRVVIEKVGAASSVVWNPWAEKAAAMVDLGDPAWRGMVCVEARECRRPRGAARRRWRAPDVDGNFSRCRAVTFSEMTRWSRQRLLTRTVVSFFVFYSGRDRRFVQEIRDQSIKRGSSVKELGDRRDAANCANGSHGWIPVLRRQVRRWRGIADFGVKAQLARIPTRKEPTRTALGVIFGAAGLGIRVDRVVLARACLDPCRPQHSPRFAA